jgi:hypothetical protein
MLFTLMELQQVQIFFIRIVQSSVGQQWVAHLQAAYLTDVQLRVTALTVLLEHISMQQSKTAHSTLLTLTPTTFTRMVSIQLAQQ